MGAWDNLTLPTSRLTAISDKDFGNLSGATVPAASEYLIRSKGKVESLLRKHLAVFIVQTGDEEFFDELAGSASLLHGLEHALACGYAWAFYWDKMINVDDQWAIRARGILKELEMEAEALANVIPGVLGETDTAIGSPQVSVTTSGIGRRGNTQVSGPGITIGWPRF